MDNTKLIAEARAKAAEPMLGKSQWRELDKSIAMIRRLADALEAAEAELTRLREIVLSGTTPGDTGTIYLDSEKTLDQVWDALNGVPAAAPVSLEAVKAETVRDVLSRLVWQAGIRELDGVAEHFGIPERWPFDEPAEGGNSV